MLSFVLLFSSCIGKYNEEEHSPESEGHNYNVDFSLYKISNLTNDEILARDVYRTLSKTTKSNVFYNIPISEQKHMDVFHQLITRYNLEDPVKNESSIGTYTDKTFTKLYNDLIKKGKSNIKNV